MGRVVRTKSITNSSRMITTNTRRRRFGICQNTMSTKELEELNNIISKIELENKIPTNHRDKFGRRNAICVAVHENLDIDISSLIAENKDISSEVVPEIDTSVEEIEEDKIQTFEPFVRSRSVSHSPRRSSLISSPQKAKALERKYSFPSMMQSGSDINLASMNSTNNSINSKTTNFFRSRPSFLSLHLADTYSASPLNSPISI